MAIKQVQLFDSVLLKSNLDLVQKIFDAEFPPAWGVPDLNEQQLKIVDYYNHQKDRWEFIQQQEKELSDSIADGWTVIATYHLDHGVAGCQLILYKPDLVEFEGEHSNTRGKVFYRPVPDSDKAV